MLLNSWFFFLKIIKYIYIFKYIYIYISALQLIFKKNY